MVRPKKQQKNCSSSNDTKTILTLSIICCEINKLSSVPKMTFVLVLAPTIIFFFYIFLKVRIIVFIF
jgi:hypothetical protein